MYPTQTQTNENFTIVLYCVESGTLITEQQAKKRNILGLMTYGYYGELMYSLQ